VERAHRLRLALQSIANAKERANRGAPEKSRVPKCVPPSARVLSLSASYPVRILCDHIFRPCSGSLTAIVQLLMMTCSMNAKSHSHVGPQSDFSDTVPDDANAPEVRVPRAWILGFLLCSLLAVAGVYSYAQRARPKISPSPVPQVSAATTPSQTAGKEAAAEKFSLAMSYLREENGKAPDAAKGVALMKEVADGDSHVRAYANAVLAEAYYLGVGVEPDARRAAERLAPLVESPIKDDSTRIFVHGLYGWLLYYGEGVPQDQARAVEVWLRAGQSDYKIVGQTYLPVGLARAYATGAGVKKDLGKAREQFQRMIAADLEPLAVKLEADGVLGPSCPSGYFRPEEWINSRYRRFAAEAEAARAMCLLRTANVERKRSGERGLASHYRLQANSAMEAAETLGYQRSSSARVELRKTTGVRVGMTAAEALQSSWGKPEHINKTITASGIREQWVYPHGNYLYMTDGVLTAIQN
jgi:TPR repeat protein